MSLDMANKWRKVLLGDACSKIGSGATPRGGKEAYLGGATALIRSQNIYNDRFVHDGIVFIDDKQAGELRNVVVEEGDVLLNITGDSVARCCQVAPDVLPARVNQHVSIIRPKPDVFDARFLRYAFINPAMQAHLLGLASVGATRNALTKGVIESLSISAPPLEQQRAIAHILGTLDDKIDLNRRINQTLEAMAQAIFKSWFVDFDPVKAKIAAIEQGQDPLRAAMCAISGKTELELDQMPRDDYEELAATAALFPDAMEKSELGGIPKGWVVSDMRSLAEVISKGTTPSKPDLATAKDEPIVPFIKVKDISETGEIARGNLELIARSIHESSLKRSILKTDDLLFSIAGTIGRTAFVDSDLNGANVNQAIAFIRLKDQTSHLSLCWLTLRSIETQNFIASKVVQAVQANASLANVGDIPIRLPGIDVLRKWNGIVSLLILEYRARQGETRSLATLRDTLLPKLLSGELSVADIHQEVAA